VLFFTLLLLNVALFGYFHTREQGPRPGSAPHSQLNPERVQLATSASATGAQNPGAKLACYEWGAIPAERMNNAEEALAKLNLGERLTRPKAQEFFVHIPPFKTAKDAEKKLGELKQLEIADATLVNEPGKWRWAIAFGAHATEQDAIVQLNQLKEKGVKSAKIAARDTVANAFAVAGVDEKLGAELGKVAQGFEGSELKVMECAAGP
jgi:hypothetical protein